MKQHIRTAINTQGVSFIFITITTKKIKILRAGNSPLKKWFWADNPWPTVLESVGIN